MVRRMQSLSEDEGTLDREVYVEIAVDKLQASVLRPVGRNRGVLWVLCAGFIPVVFDHPREELYRYLPTLLYSIKWVLIAPRRGEADRHLTVSPTIGYIHQISVLLPAMVLPRRGEGD